MRSRIIDKDVTRQVEHLDALIGHHMESLLRLVRRESTILTAGMPIGIYHRTAKLVVTRLQPFALPIYLEHRCPMLASHMEDEFRRISLMSRVAVDTHAWHLRILDDGILVERRQIALIESHLAEHLIAWSDTAIRQSPLIQRIDADIDGKVFILQPLTILPFTDGKDELSSFVLCRQLVPLIHVEIGEITLGM